MQLVEGLNYRQWQKRNTEGFKSLSKSQRKEARKQGYYNLGWNKIKTSWKIISRLVSEKSSSANGKTKKKVVRIFEHKLNQGDLTGAINLSILEADDAKNFAQKAIKELNENYEKLDKLADEALEKYCLL